LPALTALSFQTVSAVAPFFRGPKSKVFWFEVSAPPLAVEPEDPDRTVGLCQFRLWIADAEGQGGTFALLALDRDVHGQRRNRLVACVADAEIEQVGLSQMLVGREACVGHLHPVVAFRLVGVRGRAAAAGRERESQQGGQDSGNRSPVAVTRDLSGVPPQSGRNIPRGLPCSRAG
jgi:hypothetical protein